MLGFVGFMFLGLSILFWVLAIPAVLFFLFSVYFLYARHQFSLQGGKVQDRVWTLVLANLDWNGEGKALDIGCGNGALAIKLAKKNLKLSDYALLVSCLLDQVEVFYF